MRSHKKFFVLGTAVLGALPTQVAAQDVDQIEAIVAEHAETGAFTGNVLVVRNGEIIFEESHGLANQDWQIPNDAQTRFRIGSVTKQFTAASILILRERGLIDVDAPVGTYLPDAPESWSEVTIRHLLQHQTGIPELTQLEAFSEMQYLPVTQEQVIASFSDLPLEFTPGERWSYSNSNYVILTAIIEAVSGESYGDFLQANIFDPAGMDETGLDDNSAVVPRRATGYFPSEGEPRIADYINMDIPRGGGGLYSTTHDLLAWQRALMSGEILSAESLDLMTTPGHSDYAMGVMIDRQGDDLVWHGGGINGFNSWLGTERARDLTIVVLANKNGGAANTIARNIVELAREED